DGDTPQGDVLYIVLENADAGCGAAVRSALAGDRAAGAVAADCRIAAITVDRKTAGCILNADAIVCARAGRHARKRHVQRSRASGSVDVDRLSTACINRTTRSRNGVCIVGGAQSGFVGSSISDIQRSEVDCSGVAGSTPS